MQSASSQSSNVWVPAGRRTSSAEPRHGAGASCIPAVSLQVLYPVLPRLSRVQAQNLQLAQQRIRALERDREKADYELAQAASAGVEADFASLLRSVPPH